MLDWLLWYSLDAAARCLCEEIALQIDGLFEQTLALMLASVRIRFGAAYRLRMPSLASILLERCLGLAVNVAILSRVQGVIHV